MSFHDPVFNISFLSVFLLGQRKVDSKQSMADAEQDAEQDDEQDAELAFDGTNGCK